VSLDFETAKLFNVFGHRAISASTGNPRLFYVYFKSGFSNAWANVRKLNVGIKNLHSTAYRCCVETLVRFKICKIISDN
jgi:hypothetical protein